MVARYASLRLTETVAGTPGTPVTAKQVTRSVLTHGQR